ncbi:MAG: alpha/beta hydrolase [Opitutaceae bacterium]
MADAKSYFRTTEKGQFPFPNGSLKFMTVKSPALKGRADLSVYVPKQAEGRSDVPVVILLHGVYGSHWIWASMGKAHLSLQAMIDAGELPPMVLAMPSDGLWGDGSGYVSHKNKNFEQWIVEDVPQAVSELTGNSIEAPHFIGGLSMGGFGAMRLGASYPERFAAFSGHSSITHLDQMSMFVEEPLESYGYGEQADVSTLKAILENRERLRPFRFDCGVDDVLIEHNRALAAALKEAGIKHSYQEFPGAHEWIYWETHVRKTYAFFAECL